MRGPRATEGATMIIVVLFTLLLLAGILAATLRLGLGSRQNTADQAATLRAQYAAESGVALAQSRLRDVEALLSPNRTGAGGSTIDHIVVPYSTTPAVLKVQAEQFCNQVGSASSWTPTSEFLQVRTGSRAEDVEAFPEAKACEVAAGAPANQFELLAQYVQPAAFDVLPSTPGSERPSNVADPASRLQWWNSLLRQEQAVGEARFTLRPVRAVQLTPVKYRFYFRLEGLRVRGQLGGATRVLTASRTAENQWWFEIELPSLLEDVLMTNHHRLKPSGTYSPTGAPTVNFDDQVFDGSIHTNEKFLFTGNSRAQFRGKVSSVGCTDLPKEGLAPGGNCESTAGVHIGNSTPTPAPDTENTAEKQNKWLADEVAKSPRTVNFLKNETDPTKIDYKKTDFNAAYKPLPINENDQKAAALAEGLMLGNALGVELMAGGSNGLPLNTTYDASAQKWPEPNPVFQYIRFLKAGSQTVRECSWTDTPVWADLWNTGLKRWDPLPEWTAAPDLKKGRASHNDGRNNGYWMYAQNCRNVTEKVIDTNNEYRVDKDGNLSKKNSSGSWISQGRKFNGVIYGERFESLRGPDRRSSNKEDGSLGNVPPALASFAGVTIASSGDVKVDTDLTMSDTPCSYASLKATPPCTKKPKNILGIYSQDGDIILSEKTRRDLNLHTAMIASTGEVTAQNYSNRLPQGDVHLIGSLIENWYGAFGLVGDRAGYGRDFTYDQRLKEGVTPPFFPVSPRWTITAAAETEPQKGLGKVVMRQMAAEAF
ncbi:hypothetical protein F8S09_07805 [Deinococcus sp. SDU3-2]|uniref:DUF4900 domain-containing protein n=1 Tax=Deinococcus terrestris TaxID=2651870 RepID=A0A7X1NWC7_9DEIO|nr:hypothetical protein [Deinococcus terrestris]MPY66599.1 hypothetical protein [Deinococcus terrestris]